MSLTQLHPPSGRCDNPEWFTSYRGVVYPWHCDHMGHMNNMWYIAKFDEASWGLLAFVGITPSYLRDSGCGVASLEQNVQFKRELVAGDVVEIRSRLLEVGPKIIRLTHDLRNAETGETAATCAIVGIHLDRTARKSTPFPEDLRRTMERALGMPSRLRATPG